MYITFHEQLHLLHDEQPHDPIDHIHLLQDDEDNGSVNVWKSIYWFQHKILGYKNVYHTS